MNCIFVVHMDTGHLFEINNNKSSPPKYRSIDNLWKNYS